MGSRHVYLRHAHQLCDFPRLSRCGIRRQLDSACPGTDGACRASRLDRRHRAAVQEGDTPLHLRIFRAPLRSPRAFLFEHRLHPHPLHQDGLCLLPRLHGSRRLHGCQHLLGCRCARRHHHPPHFPRRHGGHHLDGCDTGRTAHRRRTAVCLHAALRHRHALHRL